MWHQMDVLLGWKWKTASLSAFNRWFMDADFGWHLIRLGGSSHDLRPHSCISVSLVKYLMDRYFSTCIYLTNTTLNCLLLIHIIFVFSKGWFTTFKPLSGCVFFFFFSGPQIVMSLYAVECVWRVGRSTLPSAPLPPSCCLKCIALAPSCAAPPPSTLFLSPHQTSLHALCSLDVCALNPSTPFIPTVPLLPPQPWPFIVPPPAFLHLHLVPVLQMSHYQQGLLGALTPTIPFFFPDLELIAVGRGMCPRLEVQTVKHTTCTFCWGRKQQYYGVRTDGCQFLSSSQ